MSNAQDDTSPYGYGAPPPPPRRRSRPITLTLLSAAVLSSCVCCLFPAPQNANDGGGGEFGPQPGPDGTPTTAWVNADGVQQQGQQQQTVRHGYMPFWLPLFLPRTGGGFGGPPRGPNVNTGPRQTGPGVSRGGFGQSSTFGGGG